MKYSRLIVIALFLCSISVFSQDNNIKHTIVKGETISSIAQKYNVSIESIYKLNPKAKKTLHLNQVLEIPNSESKKPNNLATSDSEKTTEINHQVLPKETLYGITKQFKTSKELLYKANPKLETEGLKIGQSIIIPSGLSKKEIASLSNSAVVETVETVALLTHEVRAKESLYVIAKQYGVSLKELQKQNPDVGKKGLSIGQKIVIPANGKISEKEAIVEEKKSNAKEEVTVVEKKETAPVVVETVGLLTHEVRAKESLYIIAKQYGVSLKELQKQNPDIGNKGLSIGQKIVIPANGKMPANEVVVEETKPIAKEEVVVAEKKETAPVVEPVAKAKGTKNDPQIQTIEIIHEVLTKETKYGIAKKYGITVTELERQNPTIQKKMLVGVKLSIQVPKDKIEIEAKPEVVGVKDETQTDKQEEAVNVLERGSNAGLIDQIIQFASDKIGTRYRSGGTTTAGFDCSGLMYSTFGAFDIKLPRSSIEQASIGEKINNENAQKGDLIFFKTNGRSQINHVGMIVEVVEDEIKFIHSSTHSGVIISSTKEPYYQRNFAQVNRVVK